MLVSSTPKNKAKITHGTKPCDQAAPKRPSNNLVNVADPTIALVSVPIATATADPLQDHDKGLKGLNDSNKTQASSGVVVQMFCFTVLQMPDIEFDIDHNFDIDHDSEEFKKIKNLETSANATLASTRNLATRFIKEIMPEVITNISNIDNQMQLTKAIPTVLPKGSTKDQWIAVLQGIENQANEYAKVSNDTAKKLLEFSTEILGDSQAFKEYSSKLNTLIKGDKGVLQDLRDRKNGLKKEREELIGGLTGSIAANVGGIAMIAVGAISAIPTGGASTPLIIGGVAAFAGGVAGDTLVGIRLAEVEKSMCEEIRNIKELNSQVQYLESVAPTFQNLVTGAQNAATEATNMANAWNFLAESTGKLASNLENGIITDVEILRELYLTTANKTIETIETDIARVKTTLVGIKLKMGRKGETLDSVIRRTQNSPQQLTLFSQEVGEPAPMKLTSADAVIKLNKNVASAGVVMKTYALSIIAQNKVNLGEDAKDNEVNKKLDDLNERFDKALKIARSHAKEYLDVVEPLMLSNISDIENYYEIQNSISFVTTPNTPKETWLQVIAELCKKSQDSLSKSEETLRALKSVKAGFENVAATISSLTIDLNNLVNGDEGMLKTLRAELDNLNVTINGAASAVAMSALGVVGGIVMVVVGALGTIETSGVSASIIVGGVGVITGGTAALPVAAATLAEAEREKKRVIEEKADLNAGISLAAIFSTSFKSTSKTLSGAILALESMTESWKQLKGKLKHLFSDTQNGILAPDEVRQIFVEDAVNDVKEILHVVQVIKDQWSGVEVISDPKVSLHTALKHRQFHALLLPRLTVGSGTHGKPFQTAPNPTTTLSENIRNIQKSPENSEVQNSELVKSAVTGTTHLVADLSKRASKFVSDTMKDIALANEQCESGQMKELQATIHKIELEVDSMNSVSNSTKAHVDDFEEQLIKFTRDLEAQKSKSQGEFESLKNRLKKAQHDYNGAKKYKDAFLALGILGPPGIVAAIALTVKAHDHVKDISRKTHNIEWQLRKEQHDLTASTILSNGMRSLIVVLGSLQNALSIISGELSSIKTDVAKEDKVDGVVITLHLNAAAKMLQTFQRESA